MPADSFSIVSFDTSFPMNCRFAQSSRADLNTGFGPIRFFSLSADAPVHHISSFCSFVMANTAGSDWCIYSGYAEEMEGDEP